ncbi:hypothetical protein ACOME3_003096 [Neoechinorhynchus agilis]
MTSDDHHHAMKMYFHGGVDEVVLFTGWRIKSTSAMVWSCIGIAILSAMYEGIKILREYLLQIQIVKGCSRLTQSRYLPTAVPDEQPADQQCCVQSANGNSCGCPVGVIGHSRPPMARRIFSVGHTIQTLLHLVQIATGFMLMLIAMTFNTYLFLAVVLGSVLGHWLFGWRRTSLMDCNESCH